MNISTSAFKPFSSYPDKASSFKGAHSAADTSALSDYANDLARKNRDEEQEGQTRVQKLIRQINKSPQTDANGNRIYTDTINDKKYGSFGTSSAKKTGSKSTHKYNYNYRDVANRIRRAKTSVGAGQAVIAAKRKVVEIRRKIAAGNDDADSLQIALTHARRMEMAARKKKNHLELEELVKNTQRSDENAEKREESFEDIKNAALYSDMEEVSKQEDEIFAKREEMLAEYTENARDISDDMLKQVNEMISEFGEEELKALEETMENLENMEIIDPHMSEEDFEKLKRKHRDDENKAILKAEMDYLKSTFKQMSQSGSSSFSAGQTQNLSAFSTFAVQTPETVAPAADSFVDISM